MMTDTESTGFELRRRYRATRERLFRAFTDAEDLRGWYAPVSGWIVSHAEVDARVGGSYHLEFGPPGGEPIVEKATFVEFDPPARLVIKLALSGGIAEEATWVTVDFLEHGDETEVVVRETGYSSEEVARMHEGGWTTMVEQLRGVVGEQAFRNPGSEGLAAPGTPRTP
jgi:uncharacterized protein YndB with AHSA1/START domain